MRITPRFQTVLPAVVGAAVLLFACGKTFTEGEMPNTFELKAGTAIQAVPSGSLTDLALGDEFAGVLTTALYYRSDAIDEDGRSFERKVLIAPSGAVVHGVAVADESAPAPSVGVRLTSVTFHGGKTFPVTTDVVSPNLNPPEGIETAAPMSFKLVEPADVALVIEYRRSEREGA